MMRLSISNIGWLEKDDIRVYGLMKKYGYSGLEIAPTRIFSEQPYTSINAAFSWSRKLKKNYGFEVPSMQSIWFGRQERIFGTEEERQILTDYTKKAINFAEAIGCKNLVFGCPRNRCIPEGADTKFAVDFFRELGVYAAAHSTIIGVEANPPIYNTNYINDTRSAFELIEEIGSEGFRLNLDMGTMIENNEDISELLGKVHLIQHIHISEPRLKPIRERSIHAELKKILEKEKYQGFISIEMGMVKDIQILENVMRYVKEVFG